MKVSGMSVFFFACKGVEPLEAFPENFWTEPPEKTFLVSGNRECPDITRGLAEHWVYRMRFYTSLTD